MLSKLLSTAPIFKGLGSRAWTQGNQIIKQNLISKRWSGHNSMDISPATTDVKFITNWVQFYLIIAGIPIVVATTITNIRANPELSEVPEGYEPRHWEYYKHPWTRFIARYISSPDEYEQECFLALYQDLSEKNLINRITRNCEKVMAFYNDHRTMNFIPFYGEHIRANRDEAGFVLTHSGTELNENLDAAREPAVSEYIAVEGFLAGPDPK